MAECSPSLADAAQIRSRAKFGRFRTTLAEKALNCRNLTAGRAASVPAQGAGSGYGRGKVPVPCAAPAIVGEGCALLRSLPAAVCKAATATGGCATAASLVLAPARPEASEAIEAARPQGCARYSCRFAAVPGAMWGRLRCPSPSTGARPAARPGQMRLERRAAGRSFERFALRTPIGGLGGRGQDGSVSLAAQCGAFLSNLLSGSPAERARARATGARTSRCRARKERMPRRPAPHAWRRDACAHIHVKRMARRGAMLGANGCGVLWTILGPEEVDGGVAQGATPQSRVDAKRPGAHPPRGSVVRKWTDVPPKSVPKARGLHQSLQQNSADVHERLDVRRPGTPQPDTLMKTNACGTDHGAGAYFGTDPSLRASGCSPTSSRPTSIGNCEEPTPAGSQAGTRIWQAGVGCAQDASHRETRCTHVIHNRFPFF